MKFIIRRVSFSSEKKVFLIILLCCALISNLIFSRLALYFYLIAMVSVLFNFKIKQNDKYLLPRSFIFFYNFFLISILISTFILILYQSVNNIDVVIKITLNYFLYFAIFFTSFFTFIYSKDSYIIFEAMLNLAICILSFAIIYYVNIIGLKRPYVFGLDSVQYSNMLSIVLTCLFILTASRRILTIKILIILISSYALTLGLSRISILSYIIVISLYTFLYNRSKRGLILLSSIIIIITIQIIFYNNLSEHLSNIKFTTSQPQYFIENNNKAVNSISERICLLKAAYSMFKENPIIGIGLMQFNYYYSNQYFPEDALDNSIIHSHNNIVNFFAEGGILVGFFFIMMYLSIIFMWFKFSLSESYAQAGFFIILTYFTIGFADMNFNSSQITRLFFLLSGYLYAIACKRKKLQI